MSNKESKLYTIHIHVYLKHYVKNISNFFTVAKVSPEANTKRTLDRALSWYGTIGRHHNTTSQKRTKQKDVEGLKDAFCEFFKSKS